MTIQPRGKSLSVTIKLLFFVFSIVLLIIGVQAVLNVGNARQRDRIETEQSLLALYNQLNEEIAILKKTAASLSLSFASRPDVRERFQVRDRQGLLELLRPVFTSLRAEYNIVHLQFHEPSGHIFLRIHAPEQYGDYTFTYRRANARAIISRRTVAGVEIDPNRLGIQGVSPMFYRGQFIGLVEVGLDYDQAFIEDFKARHGADYKMWVAFKDAGPAGLGPADGALDSPAPELFYYAGTDPTPLPIPPQIYLAVLGDGEPRMRFVSTDPAGSAGVDDQERAVLVAPMLGYGDRVIGILEVSLSRAENLAALRRSQRDTLVVAGGLALAALILMLISTNLVVLRPLGHLTAVARRQLAGDLVARVELLPRDEFGQLGHTLNVLTETLDNTLRNREDVIAERTAELMATNERLLQEVVERKRTQAELQNITDSMPSVLITLDPGGRVLTWNPAAEALTGRTAEEMRGQSLWQTCPELSHYRDLFERVLKEGQVAGRHRQPVITETGTIYYDVDVFPLVAEDVTEPAASQSAAEGAVAGAVLRIDDVTQRVQLEEMMLQSAKMASVGGLAAGVAHEINNPLGAIMQSAQMLQMAFDTQRPWTRERLEKFGVDVEGLGRYLDERGLNDYLDGIRITGARAAKIVSDLLTFSRRSSSKVAKQDLNRLVEQTLELAATDYDLRRKYDFRDIEIVRELAGDMPDVLCDGQQIQQVVLNLVRNAAQAMGGKIERGDGEWRPRLTLRTSYQIENQESETPSRIRLEVEDNGPGVPEELRGRLFEPFYTTKDVGEGTGLGLWLCWSIVVERHKGQMWVETGEEGGTRFVVELPIG